MNDAAKAVYDDDDDDDSCNDDNFDMLMTIRMITFYYGEHEVVPAVFFTWIII